MSELQDHLDALRARQAPIPLTEGQANAQARRLLDVGMSYTAISQAMGVYHGQWYQPTTWNMRLRKSGLHKPRGYKNGRPRPAPQRAEKLTPGIAEKIREAYAQGDVRHVDLAERFGVSETQIARILHGECWREAA